MSSLTHSAEYLAARAERLGLTFEDPAFCDLAAELSEATGHDVGDLLWKAENQLRWMRHQRRKQ